MEPGRIEVFKDPVEEKLDDLAGLFEHWTRNRGKGRTPNAIRSAIIMSMEEIILLSNLCTTRNSKVLNLRHKPCHSVVVNETMADVLERSKNRKSDE